MLVADDQADYILFTRPDCHLCDVAAEMLDDIGLPWRKENIDSDLNLIRRYGVRIPVVFRPDSGEELFWPFDPASLARFVNTT